MNVKMRNKILDSYMQNEIAQRKHLGLSLGIYESGIDTFFNYGFSHGAPITEINYFEIASISKVFTSLLILRLARESLFHLEDFVESIIPELKVKDRIRIKDLLTHTAGLEREPPNFQFIAPKNSYLNYNDEMLIEAAKSVEINEEFFGCFRYSNFGYILLGLIARRASGVDDFKQLLTDKVLKPLNLTNTVFDLDQNKINMLCWGHSSDLEPIAPYLDLGNTFSSAGALITTTAELLQAFKLFLHPESLAPSLVNPANDLFLIFRDKLEQPISYGFHIFECEKGVAYFHPGNIAGHKCNIAISKDLNKVIAYNTTTLQHVHVLWKLFFAEKD
jgi:CubicO group peptidase (beta-lactamase class C family)